jgi:hypothetical protein
MAGERENAAADEADGGPDMAAVLKTENAVARSRPPGKVSAASSPT